MPEENSEKETGSFEDLMELKQKRASERKEVVMKPDGTDKVFPFTIKRLTQKHEDKIQDEIVKTKIGRKEPEADVDSVRGEVLTIKYGVEESPEGFNMKSENQIRELPFRSELADVIDNFSEIEDGEYVNF